MFSPSFSADPDLSHRSENYVIKLAGKECFIYYCYTFFLNFVCLFVRILVVSLIAFSLCFLFFFIYFVIICPVPGCSGMFRNVPASSGMFHVPGFVDALYDLPASGS